MKTAVLKAGGEIRLHEPVERIEIENGRATGVRTPSGLIRADAVVLAAGAWSSQIKGVPYEAVPPVYPVKGEVLVLAPPPGAGMPKLLIWGCGIYLVPRHEGLLVGATVEHAGYDLSSTKAAKDWLLRQARALMPALETWRVSDHRVGLRPASPDGMPILGASAVDGLFIRERPVSQRHLVCSSCGRRSVPSRSGTGFGRAFFRSQAVFGGRCGCKAGLGYCAWNALRLRSV